MQLLMLILIFFISLKIDANEGEELKKAIKDYDQLVKSLEILSEKKESYCKINFNPSFAIECSVSNFCKMADLKPNSEFIYKNADGRMILNQNIYDLRTRISACLKDKFKDNLDFLKEEKTLELKNKLLSRVKEENDRFTLLLKKNKEEAKIAKIQNEILNQILLNEMIAEENVWNKNGATREELSKLITKIEGKLKIKLTSEVKKSLVEIRYSLKNADYSIVDKQVEKIFSYENKNPFINFDLILEEKNLKELKDKTKEAFLIFEETKKDLISWLNEKKNKQNSPMIDRAIERVNTIKFSPFTLKNYEIKECRTPNAYYLYDSHTFTICPQYLLMPKIALKETIAHELAHSFDPCNFSKPLLKNNGPVVEEEGQIDIPIQQKSEGNFSLDGSFDFSRAILQSENPFSSTIACLKKSDSIGANDIDYKKIKKLNTLELEKMKSDPSYSNRLKYADNLEKNIDDLEKYFGACDLKTKNLGLSKMQEAFADKVSSEIVARNIKFKSLKDAQKEIAETIISYGEVCFNSKESEEMIRSFAKKYQCDEFYETRKQKEKYLVQIQILENKYFDAHPDNVDRLEKILLVHPEIRKKLNCSSDLRGKYCE